jgi:hypothetical protein
LFLSRFIVPLLPRPLSQNAVKNEPYPTTLDSLNLLSTVQKPGLALARLPAFFNRQTVDKTMTVANVVCKMTDWRSYASKPPDLQKFHFKPTGG